MNVGAIPLGANRWQLTVWAPYARQVEVAIGSGQSRQPLVCQAAGLWQTELLDCPAGTTYQVVLDGQARPDPASRWQPQGVHGPSALFDPNLYSWSDQAWQGCPAPELVIYELHVGTATAAGDLDAAIAILPHIADLGITAIELMPLAQFPGARNWGYDGTFPYAVQHSYGGPAALQRFVDAAHQAGLAVLLDVVYNHLGHEGNYLWGTAPYFSKAYTTPWGPALNVDGAGSDQVRQFFIASALYWLETFHLDGLRLDAVDWVIDASAYPFLQELGDQIAQLEAQRGTPIHTIAESLLNDPRFIAPATQGGYGLSAQWTDDLHHSLHAYLTGDRREYYKDFGEFEQLVAAYQHPYIFQGQYSAYWQRRRGTPQALRLPPQHYIVYAQNHDQIGNQQDGQRLSQQLSPQLQRLALALIILSPYIPQLFMGEEYGETAPFQFFTDYSDPVLIEGVRLGRSTEFSEFFSGTVDPQDPELFAASKLQWLRLKEPKHQAHLAYTRELLQWRRQIVKGYPEVTVPQIGQLSLQYGDYQVLFNLDAQLSLPEGCLWQDGQQVAILTQAKA